MQTVTTNHSLSDGPTRRLGGGDIGLCLTRLHHDRFTTSSMQIDEVRRRDARLGLDHEARILDVLTSTIDGAIDIPRGADEIGATRDALAAGAPLIVGARLGSRDGTSIGLPDVLVRLDDGYASVEVKNHKVLGTSGINALSVQLDALTDILHADLVKFRSNRRRDLLQVEHYRRLLSEIGHASTAALGGVIGSDEPYRCLWVDLDTGVPSIADEHAEYLETATEVIAHGAKHPDDPLEPPRWRGECKRCDWATRCKTQLEEAGDVTLLSTITAGYRDLLADEGITQIDQIAAMDPSDERLPGPSVVLQARARTADRLLRFDDATTPLDVPTSRTEADFDIETYNGRIYLAGFLVSSNGTSVYEPIIDWSGELSGERVLVEAMFAKLAEFASDGTTVQHWTDYERRALRSAGELHGLAIPGSPSIDAWFDDHAVDLCGWTRKNLVSPNGYSLKVIAPLCGFEWRDDDPGGRQSEIWFEQLLAGDRSMRSRLLEYNEDDVVAQREIRRWIHMHDSGSGPGTAIPSVRSWPLATVEQ